MHNFLVICLHNKNFFLYIRKVLLCSHKSKIKGCPIIICNSLAYNIEVILSFFNKKNIMKILVCISSVPDTTSKIEFIENNSKLDTEGMQFIINPHDEYVLAKAMSIKEKQGATITVINIGLSTSDAILRKALAIGADDAIRVNVEAKDSLFVARQIGKVVLSGDYDLILAGKESIDYNGNMVPGLLASITNLPFANAVIGLNIEGEEASITREVDGGNELLKAKLPVVLAGQKGLVAEEELKIPNMRGIMMARKKQLKVLDATEEDAMTDFVKLETIDAKTQCKMVNADNVSELVSLLREEAKVI